MSQRVEVRCACAIAHPQSFLTCGFETGIVSFALCTQGIDTLKTQAFPVNGKSVVCWNGLILGVAPVFLAVIPVFVAARVNTGLGLAEGTAEFLPNSPSAIGGFAIFVHGEACLADRIASRKRFRGFRAAWIEGDKRLALIDRFTVL